jgi:hypothetical protein
MKRIQASHLLPIVLVSFLAVLLLTHCSTKSQAVRKAEEEGALRSRIEEYWKYRIDGKVEKAYECELPEYRGQVPILQYVQPFKIVRPLEAEILEIDIKDHEAQGVIKLTYIYMLKNFTNKKMAAREVERWKRIKGVWYHVPESFKAETKSSYLKRGVEGREERV